MPGGPANIIKLFPHIKHVMQKFSSQLPKEDLKKFAKEVGKKLVASDFKNNRVEDPTKISEKQEKKVKSYVKEFFEKAVQKKIAIDKRRKEKEKARGANGSSKEKKPLVNGDKTQLNETNSEASPTKDGADVDMSDDEDHDLGVSFPDPSPSIPATPLESPDLKRKREDSEFGTPADDSESKRFKEECIADSVDISPPPPPPPPPAGGMPEQELDGSFIPPVKEESEEDKELRKQEEDLMRENEQALMMDLDGSLRAQELDSKLHDIPRLNGNGIVIPLQAKDSMEGVEEAEIKHEQNGILSH
jgi:hypothetical protein